MESLKHLPVQSSLPQALTLRLKGSLVEQLVNFGAMLVEEEGSRIAEGADDEWAEAEGGTMLKYDAVDSVPEFGKQVREAVMSLTPHSRKLKRIVICLHLAKQRSLGLETRYARAARKPQTEPIMMIMMLVYIELTSSLVSSLNSQHVLIFLALQLQLLHVPGTFGP